MNEFTGWHISSEEQLVSLAAGPLRHAYTASHADLLADDWELAEPSDTPAPHVR